MCAATQRGLVRILVRLGESVALGKALLFDTCQRFRRNRVNSENSHCRIASSALHPFFASNGRRASRRAYSSNSWARRSTAAFICHRQAKNDPKRKLASDGFREVLSE
jgi:hypothetical protein